MGTKLPKKWNSTNNISEVIDASLENGESLKFFIFKTPIKDTSWAPKHVLTSCPELLPFNSLIINVKPNTFSEDRYDPSQFQVKGIDYKSVYVRGTGKPPPDFVVKTFFDLVDDFVEEHPSGVVGVHGTLGVDRPGYLVARYLIEKFGRDPDEVIYAVDSARGESISRKDDLLVDLRTRSSLWETIAMQHGLVIKFTTDQIASSFKGCEEGKIRLLQECLTALPVDLEASIDNVTVEKSIWLGTLHFVVWFSHRAFKKKIEGEMGNMEWNEDRFQIERLEDRSNVAKRGHYNQLQNHIPN